MAGDRAVTSRPMCRVYAKEQADIEFWTIGQVWLYCQSSQRGKAGL